jgi:hypothetical protein
MSRGISGVYFSATLPALDTLLQSFGDFIRWVNHPTVGFWGLLTTLFADGSDPRNQTLASAAFADFIHCPQAPLPSVELRSA